MGYVRVFIDLDNTLVVNPMGRYVFPRVYAEVGSYLGIEPSRVRDALVEEHLRRVSSDPIHAYDWDYILGIVLSKLGYPRRIDLLSMHEETCHLVEVLDGAPRVLEELVSMGVQVVLATNGLWKYQRCVVRNSGIAEYIDAVLTPDSVGALKNSRRFFYILRPVDTMISVGDNPVFDIYFPSLFGLETVYVKRGRGGGEIYMKALGIAPEEVRPTAVISSLAELPSVVESLIGGGS